MKRRLLIIIAVVVFVTFAGLTGYQSICPISQWTVDCFKEDVSDAGVIQLINEDSMKNFVERAEKSGLTCHVFTARKCFGTTFIAVHKKS